jgi:hypothetical protein
VPVLFLLLYISDDLDLVNHFNIKLYGDVVLLYRPVTSTHDCELIIQEDLRAICLRTQMNRIECIFPKSNVDYKNSTNRKQRSGIVYPIDNKPIQSSNCSKYPRLYSQDYLTFL